MAELELIKINLNWRDVFNLINGIGGWKQRLGLNISYSTSIHDDTQEWGPGGVIWRGIDFSVVLIVDADGEASVIQVQMDNNKSPSIEARKTWILLNDYFRPSVDKSSKENTTKPENLFENLDGTDQQILNICLKEPWLYDKEVGARLDPSLGRQAVWVRRNKLKTKFPEIALKVSRQKMKMS